MIKSDREKSIATPDTEDLLAELTANTSDAVKSLRRATRLSIRATVYVEPASVSMRNGSRLQGMTGDLSVGGCLILLPRPLLVGDVYQLTFDRNELDLPPTFCLCLRGRQVRADAYEAGLRFLEQISLPGAKPEQSGGLI